MSLTLTVHRGTQQIGGSCIEIVHPDGDRIILDAGRPLDALEGATGLLPESLDRGGTATVLISHSHQDHWGLLNEIPETWPVWTGSQSAKLIGIVGELMQRPRRSDLHTWTSRSGTFKVGPFDITPILTDHSAYDAYMLLLEGAGKRILYTGDFRKHGRKSSLVDRLIADPPRAIDALIIEGTNLGTDKPVKSEQSLEDEFVELFHRTQGRAFVEWSGQNIDRTVTLYRAAQRSGRTLAIDLYTADVLDRISEGTGIPRAGFPNLEVVITRGLRNSYARQGREEFVSRMAKNGISARELESSRHVIMLRKGLLRDYVRAGVTPTARDAFNYSMWRGYLAGSKNCEAYEWCRAAEAEITYLHTSGHASAADLQTFAAAVNPTIVIPVHGANWDTEGHAFNRLHRLKDGERILI